MGTASVPILGFGIGSDSEDLIIDFTVVQIQDKFQIEFRHSSFYGVPELKNELSIDLQKRVLTKSAHFNCGTL